MFLSNSHPKSGYVQSINGSNELDVFYELLTNLSHQKACNPTHDCAKTSLNHILILNSSIHQTLENINNTKQRRIKHLTQKGYPIPQNNTFGIIYHPHEVERSPPQLTALCLNTLLDMLQYHPSIHLPCKHGTLCANDVNEALETIQSETIDNTASSCLTP
jgi:hypothetical protein